MNKEGYVKNGGMGVKKIVNHKMMRQEDIDRLIEDAWLGLDIREEEIFNPIKDIPEFFHEEPHLFLTWVMSRPEYISMFCKEIMNITIAPQQALVIMELWTHKFPMLLASRGFGKTFLVALYCMLRAIFLPGRKIVIVGSAFRQAKLVFEYCETIWRGAPLLRDMVGQGKRDDQVIQHDSSMWTFKIGESRIHAAPMGDGCQIGSTQLLTDKGFTTIEQLFTPQDVEPKDYFEESVIWGNGKFRDSDAKHFNGFSKTKKITTKSGFSLEATYNHKYKVLTKSGIEWKRTDELNLGDYLLIDRSERWHSGIFDCAVDEAYALGAMIANGCWTQEGKLGFSNMDMEIVDRVRSGNIPLQQLSDKIHFAAFGKTRTEFLNKWGMVKNYSHEKYLPDTILSSSKEKMVACLQGLFDGDGTLQVSTAKGGTGIIVSYCSTSKRLIDQIQFILLHLGILCFSKSRDRNEKWNTAHELLITGKDVLLFQQKINFFVKRKRESLENGIIAKKVWRSSGDTVPYSQQKLAELRRTFKLEGSRCARDIERRKNITFDLGNKIIEDAIQNNGNKQLIDELSIIFDRNLSYEEIVSIEDSESLTYDVHIPEDHEYCANGFFSHNTTIRGIRANDTINDEFASINRSVFENVVAGFGVVTQDPIENMKFLSRKEMKRKLGVEDTETINDFRVSNQLVLSGTAYYRFNHFFTYFEKYRNIIRSCGDKNRLVKVIGDEATNPDFDWKDYAIIRIPYDQVAKGYFDAATISRNKVNTLASNFLAEYCACFPADSDGFFKRSLIEKATPSNSNKIELGGKIIDFVPKIVGNPMSRYVIAIDPASEEDNCALIILELMDDHRRVVYSWTTNKKLHRRNLTIKKTDESNYWAFVVRKIRNLMSRFPTVAIVIDSQGGGNAIREGLSDKDKLQNNEQQIWPIINQQKQEYSDTQEGLHIIHMFNFASNELLSNAYFNTKKDLDTQQLVFPSFDGATLGLVECETDDTNVVDGGLEDTLEGIVEEIEELKNELTCIMHTKLPSGRDQFSVPDIKTADGKKARVKKDRASALIMANSTSRAIMRDHIDTTYESNGGYATPQKQENGLLYSNVWYGKATQDAYADL